MVHVNVNILLEIIKRTYQNLANVFRPASQAGIYCEGWRLGNRKVTKNWALEKEGH